MAELGTVEWLLDADPALRWQVERDLLGRPASVWTATRARVATEGFGARLLARQDPDGHVDGIVDWLLEHQLGDGGWNCEWVNGATRSSFHSTLNALKALLDYERVTGDRERVRTARQAGAEYLLSRDLHRRRSTGEAVGPWVWRLSYPFRWSYTVLNAAEYLRAATVHDGGVPDRRMTEAIEWIRGARQPDGTWLSDGPYPGREWFAVDVPAGEPSKWLTFSALRVLAWWDAGSAPMRQP